MLQMVLKARYRSCCFFTNQIQVVLERSASAAAVTHDSMTKAAEVLGGFSTVSASASPQ